ncbi:hypothetical protein ACLOJK_036936 [Asimina triloba]
MGINSGAAAGLGASVGKSTAATTADRAEASEANGTPDFGAPPEHQDMVLHHHQKQPVMAVVRRESIEVPIE